MKKKFLIKGLVNVLPILKEFELDLKYIAQQDYINGLMVENGWEYFEATKYDYEKNWKQKRMKLLNEMRCIAALYERYFKKYKFKNDICWKIAVQCVDEITDSEIKTVGGVTEVEVVFDIDNYFLLDEYEKKKIVLNTLKKGIDLVVEKEQWDHSQFEYPYKEVINLNYDNNFVWQSKLNPNRKYIAEVYCEHSISSFEIRISIKTNIGTEVKSVPLISERPNEWSFVTHLGKLKWISENEVALFNRDETKQWTVKI
ncbi:hypothetical protein [Pseudoneobacillus sp. C159]